MIYDIIIIGAGPAGLSAALYGLRANKKVLVLEKNSYGGQIINSSCVENYPGFSKITGFEFATNLYNQVKDLGCNIIFEEVLEVKENLEVITNKNTYQGKSIILAVGATPRRLNLPLEDEFIGKGISYCATCDGAFYKDKTVAVVGGGNVSLEDALYLSNLAKKVYLIHRRDVFRGDKKTLEELKKKDNVQFILNSTITKLIGKEYLEQIEINHKEIITIDGLFIAIGQVPNTDIVKDLIELDENGYIKSRDLVHTNCKGIYVAGDARVKDLRQLVTAVSDGAIASTTCISEM